MEAIELIMKIWGIPETNREEVQNILKTTPPAGLELALMNCGQHPDDENYDPAIDAWMDQYMPQIQLSATV